MARGAKPGERRGGREKGTRNKATIEAELKAAQAQLALQDAKAQGKKLAKDVLDEFMVMFAGMAAYHQPLPPGVANPGNRDPNEAKFEKWSRLTVQVARDLAPYQSPTFRAIVVAPPPPDPRGRVTRFTLTIFDEINPPYPANKIIEHEAPAPSTSES